MWETMFRAGLGNGDRERAVALIERLTQQYVARADVSISQSLYSQIQGTMLNDAVAPWGQSSLPSQP